MPTKTKENLREGSNWSGREGKGLDVGVLTGLVDAANSPGSVTVSYSSETQKQDTVLYCKSKEILAWRNFSLKICI